MSETETEFNYEEHRAKWLKRLADELEKTEALMPFKLSLEDAECPQWVLNVEREFSVVMFPAAKLRDANYKITPKRMGALLGHLCGVAVWMMDFLIENDETSDNKEQKTPTEEEIKKAQESCVSLFDWYKAVRRLAKRALCSCVDQVYEDMTNFLLGYADAFSRKPKTFKLGNLGNTNFEIYNCMLVFWRVIDRMESVRQFHEWLVKVFGASKIGDQKRIEKMCQRMGLHFRKPGRPKKLE